MATIVGFLVGFAGGIASGKSELSRNVAKTLGWPCVGFGDYVRTVARQRGMNVKGKTLQTLGESIMAEGWEPWAAAGFVDTELSVNMEPEVGHGKTEVYTRVQA